jgi:hypothetical protein
LLGSWCGLSEAAIVCLRKESDPTRSGNGEIHAEVVVPVEGYQGGRARFGGCLRTEDERSSHRIEPPNFAIVDGKDGWDVLTVEGYCD